MSPLRIIRITLSVRDRDKMLAFYRDLLELPVKGTDSDPNFIELQAGPVTIALVKGGPLEDREFSPRLAFFTENVDAAREELELLGIKVGKIKEFGPFKSCDALDPEGNPLQITNRA